MNEPLKSDDIYITQIVFNNGMTNYNLAYKDKETAERVASDVLNVKEGNKSGERLSIFDHYGHALYLYPNTVGYVLVASQVQEFQLMANGKILEKIEEQRGMNKLARNPILKSLQAMAG